MLLSTDSIDGFLQELAGQATGDHRAGAVHAGQPAARLSGNGADLPGQCLEPLISFADLGHKVAGELPAGDPGRPGRPHPGEQLSCCGGQIRPGTARKQVPQQRVQLIDQPGPLCN